ncbi:hypothetical protein [Erythrobacter sp. SD-21]|uniref:hypothetical protein n=1 Tax=Erythrobacter sp. SD-21 TaxID=161528 RepID=UPI000153EF44|nr:hypothetical protein [Erythrobacter sp. SD-21]EDL49472.1 hypothetical protein ED21_17777 [Erythrobacter sp. SD-21]
MDIRRLDLDVAIYRDRVQVTHRSSDSFVDQRAEFPFSSEDALVAHPRHLEDTLVRAIRQVVRGGGFSLREPIVHVVGCEGKLSVSDRRLIDAALRETGMHEVIFEVEG